MGTQAVGCWVLSWLPFAHGSSAPAQGSMSVTKKTRCVGSFHYLPKTQKSHNMTRRRVILFYPLPMLPAGTHEMCMHMLWALLVEHAVQFTEKEQ